MGRPMKPLTQTELLPLHSLPRELSGRRDRLADGAPAPGQREPFWELVRQHRAQTALLASTGLSVVVSFATLVALQLFV